MLRRSRYSRDSLPTYSEAVSYDKDGLPTYEESVRLLMSRKVSSGEWELVPDWLTRNYEAVPRIVMEGSSWLNEDWSWLNGDSDDSFSEFGLVRSSMYNAEEVEDVESARGGRNGRSVLCRCFHVLARCGLFCRNAFLYGCMITVCLFLVLLVPSVLGLVFYLLFRSW
jgi:hypothetical protein